MNLFISYRRDDTEGFAGWLAELLRNPSDGSAADDVFLDVDDIPPGRDFVEDMLAAVGRADAVLVMVGPRWVRDALHNTDDPVRREIEAAIEAGVPIWCICVDNASRPNTAALPPSLHGFCSVTQVALNETTFADDVHLLRDRLAEIKPKPGRAGSDSAILEVVFPRPGFMNDGSTYSVVVDGKSLGAVKSEKRSQRFDIRPGRHRMQVRRGLRRSNAIEVQVTQGATVRLEVVAGFWEVEIAERTSDAR